MVCVVWWVVLLCGLMCVGICRLVVLLLCCVCSCARALFVYDVEFVICCICHLLYGARCLLHVVRCIQFISWYVCWVAARWYVVCCVCCVLVCDWCLEQHTLKHAHRNNTPYTTSGERQHGIHTYAHHTTYIKYEKKTTCNTQQTSNNEQHTHHTT